MNCILYSIVLIFIFQPSMECVSAKKQNHIKYADTLIKRGEKEGTSIGQSDHTQTSHESRVVCSTNQQCSLIGTPKYNYKHIWSRSPDLQAAKRTQKSRTEMFKPRKDLSTLAQPPKTMEEHLIKKPNKSEDIMQKKEKVLSVRGGRKRTYQGVWNSRRDYLRHQNREGKLTPEEAKDYKRMVKDKQEIYNKKRRDQRKAEKEDKAKAQSKDKEKNH